jgi:phospholipid-binding lipoprotein MlaA
MNEVKFMKTIHSELLIVCLICSIISLLFYPVYIQAEEGEEVDDASYSYAQGTEGDNSDPLENSNRAIFAFNEGFYEVILDPIVTVYDEILPQPIQDSISNFLYNLGEPVRFVNFVLQGDPDSAGDVMGRFLTNTIVGVGGLIDVVELDIPKKRTDFGLTLAKYDVDTGPYLIVPFFGPSSFRDVTGFCIDLGMSPFNYNWIDRTARISKAGVDYVETRDKYKPSLYKLEESSLDFYNALRSAYFQKRKIKNYASEENDI